MRNPETELSLPLAFEKDGSNRVAETDRVSSPWTFFVVVVGGSFSLGTLVFGWLPITFGLGTRDAITSIIAGTLIGLIPIAPMIAIGSHTATNNAMSSVAQFGVRGRMIGATLGLALTFVLTALAIWTSGSVLVAVSHRVWATPVNN